MAPGSYPWDSASWHIEGKHPSFQEGVTCPCYIKIVNVETMVETSLGVIHSGKLILALLSSFLTFSFR